MYNDVVHQQLNVPREALSALEDGFQGQANDNRKHARSYKVGQRLRKHMGYV
jgi:hypothetical protein